MVGTRLTVVPALSRSEAAGLTITEGQRWVDLLESLSAEQWQSPTECPPWKARDMVSHVLGNHEGLASLREQLHQLVAARRRGGSIVDALSAVQLEDRKDLTGRQLVERLRTAFPASLRARRSLFQRAVRPLRTTVPLLGQDERWSVAYLHDVIYTRDAWMHRMDICRAAAVEPVLTADHDGVMVARIVQEWADRHGQPYELELTGVAGGSFSAGTGGERITIDAVEFCRAGSGRGSPTGLLAVPVGY